MWEIDVGNQALTFALSMATGGIFCVSYDIVRAVRKVALNTFWAVLFTDILLWIIYAFVTFVFLIARTNGEIRGYVLVGEAIGFALCRISVSRLLFPILRFIAVKTAVVVRKMGQIIYVFYAKTETLILSQKKYVFKFFKSIKKLLKNIVKLLYTNRNIAVMENAFDETKTKA
ncbi:MAG: spore cortex biosynthesis protein YabQ [Clostridia bacterium]|nr:spore cortex biosynthesis protein YabQ [Clostridia bacterium]